MSAQPTMPNPGVLTCEDLLRATGFERVADLRRVLDQSGVRYFPGRGGGVWTTIDLVNAAGGLLPHAANAPALDPEGFR